MCSDSITIAFVYKPFLSAREKQFHYDFKTLLQLSHIKADYDDSENQKDQALLLSRPRWGMKNDNDK